MIVGKKDKEKCGGKRIRTMTFGQSVVKHNTINCEQIQNTLTSTYHCKFTSDLHQTLRGADTLHMPHL